MIFRIFVAMKTNEKLAKELKDAVSNIHGMNYLIDKGIVMFKPETRCVEVHYLLWHTFSKQGLVKFCHSLYFNMEMKLVASKQPLIQSEPITIWVDYGSVPNEYRKVGHVKMCKYNSVTGFEVV